MSWLIDILLVLILITGSTLGYFSGFIWQFSRFVFLIITVYITLLIHKPLADWLANRISNQFLAQLLIYLFIFLLLYLIMFFISWFIENAVDKIKLKTANRVFGGIFGLLKSALICGFILLGLIYYPAFGTSALKNSFLSPVVLRYTKKVVFFMPKNYREKIQYFLHQAKNIQSKPDQKENTE